MAGRLRFEAWTLPTSATFEKITDIPALTGSTGTRELSAYSDGTLRVDSTWDGFDLIVSDTVGSLIRVYDGSTIIDEFLAERIDSPIDRPSFRTVSGTQINGVVERLAVYPFNYPNDNTQQDWIWGGTNILPDLALADLGNINEVWELWNAATAGTFTLTVDGQTTTAIPYTGANLANYLEDLSTVSDVTVAGSGASADDPWVITFYNPPDPTTVTVTDTLTGGTSTLTKITEGTPDPSPITVTQTADQRIVTGEIGGYADPPIEVVFTNLNTGSDWALLVNATGQYAGSQILLSVKPGHTYSNISIPVRPDSAGKYRLVIRDVYENLIAGTDPWEVSLTAGSYQTLTIPTLTIPDGVTTVIMRVAVVQPTYADFRVDWAQATFQEGLAEATPGEIVRLLIENGQDERSAFTFLDIAGFSDTVDTNSVSWPNTESFTAWFGSHLGHVLGDLHDLGYEWRITPKASPSGGLTHDLELYTSDTVEDLTTSAGGPAIMSGSVPAANVVKRVPRFTAGAAWGLDSLYLEDTDATRLTNFGRWEAVFDAEHLASTDSLQQLLDARFAEQATNLTATQATVAGDDPATPLVDYAEGSKVWWQFPGLLDKEARVVRRVSWKHADISNDLASYTLHGSKVHTGESAQAAAVAKLLGKYQRRRQNAQPVTPSIGGGNGPYVIVAADDSPAWWKDIAHFVCDGLYTNDETTIQAAIDAAVTAQTDVLVAPGYYSVTVPDGGYAILSKGVRLFGPERGHLDSQSHISADYTGSTGTVISAYNGTTYWPGSELDGIRVSTYTAGILPIELSSWWYVHDCYLEAEDQHAIFGISADFVRIEDNYIDITTTAVNDGIVLDGHGFETTIRNNDINGGGIRFSAVGSFRSQTWNEGAGPRVHVVDNKILGASQWGIHFDYDDYGSHLQTAYTIIARNRIQGTGYGDSPGGGGILVSGADANFLDVTPPLDGAGLHIFDNIIEDTLMDGILLRGISGAQAHHNSIEQAGETSSYHGITLDDASSCVIDHNLISRTDDHDTNDAIHLKGTSSLNRIESNTARFSRTASGQVFGRFRYGINVAAATCDGNEIWFSDLRESWNTAPINNAGTNTSLEPGTGGSYGSNTTERGPDSVSTAAVTLADHTSSASGTVT